MSQGYTTVPVTGTHSAAEIVGDIQVNTDATQTLNSGGSAPSAPVAYQWWADTNAAQLKQRDSTNSTWIVRASLADTIVVARTSNTIIGTVDMGRTFLGSNTFTQTITAAATLGDGFWFRYRNNGAGVITLDPNASELINGAATLAIPPGGDSIVVCSGGAFYATTSGGAALRNVTVLTATVSSTYTTPVGATKIRVIALGAGGGGGGVSGGVAGQGANAGGGGAGAVCIKTYSSPAATYTYQCGAAGAAGAFGNNNGAAGASTTFDTMTAGGGAGGQGMATRSTASSATGGAGGTATGGDYNISGQSAACVALFPTSPNVGGTGATSSWGGGGAASSAAFNGAAAGGAATGYGGGGGGGVTQGSSGPSVAGGAGSSGIIFIEEYY